LPVMARDFYEVLGVSRGASEKEIRSAYRKLARKLHPDVNPNDKPSEERFKEINAANDVLSDPDKRKKYDKYGENWEHADEIERAQAGARGGRGGSYYYNSGAGPNVHFGDEIDLGDIFGGIFGGGGRRGSRAGGNARTTRTRPQPTEYKLEVTLEEAFSGTQRVLQVEGDHGDTRRLEVKIPPGVDTGSRVRIAGEGQAGFNGQRGDLYLVITVRPHDKFERKGDDLYVDVETPLSLPVLGGEVEVPTVDRKVALKIPAGTQNMQRFSLRGLGMPKLATPMARGDLYARIVVRLPQTLDESTKKIFEELREAGD
jgi:curved DNA-binding protein